MRRRLFLFGRDVCVWFVYGLSVYLVVSLVLEVRDQDTSYVKSTSLLLAAGAWVWVARWFIGVIDPIVVNVLMPATVEDVQEYSGPVNAQMSEPTQEEVTQMIMGGTRKLTSMYGPKILAPGEKE